MLKPLNPLLHSELRLGVISILVEAGEAEFTFLKEQTRATAGNLSVQLEKLSAAGYLEIRKSFKGKRPCTQCRITQSGLDAFAEYVDALRSYIQKQ